MKTNNVDTDNKCGLIKQLTDILKSACIKWKRKKIIRFTLTLDILINI